MIGSKYFNLIAIFLTALVLVGLICAIFISDFDSSEEFIGTKVFGDLHSVTLTEDDYFTGYSEYSAEKIVLNGESAESSSKNVRISGGDVTILSGGIYLISGELENGTVTVDANDKGEVRLVLDGARITSEDFAAIYVKNAEKTVISLVDGTENILTDALVYSEEKQDDGKPFAALHSKDDLVINGGGTLVLNGNFKDGIKAGDTLKIIGAKLKINSADDGMDANDYIYMCGATVTVSSAGDCVKCGGDAENKGFIAASESVFTLQGDGDGISASTALYLDGVKVKATTGGGSQNGRTHAEFMGFGGKFSDFDDTDSEKVSAKALKAGTNIVIEGGEFEIDSADDAVHSDGDIGVSGGIFSVSTGDDAFHADMNLVLEPEKIDVLKCYEGLEGAYITVNGGEISIVSDDDGINATGEGNIGAMPPGHGFGGEEKASEEDLWLTINGGHVIIETSGDGIDSNGSAVINGGTLEIYGPEDAGNGSIDVGDGGYVLLMNGGTLVAAGNSGMAESPSESSAQKSLVWYLDKTYSSESTVCVKDSGGGEIVSVNSAKEFDWFCISTEQITDGETYTLYINGAEVSSVTANGVVSVVGSERDGGAMGVFGRRKGQW